MKMFFRKINQLFVLSLILFLPACTSFTKAPVSSMPTVYIPEKWEQYRPLIPHFNLQTIPLGDGSVTSFYDSGFFRQGYVKGSYKPWEMALISWWAFDLFVGCDKDYGNPEETGNIFYTSLKPWNRKKSDMRDFAQFLSFWGWNL